VVATSLLSHYFGYRALVKSSTSPLPTSFSITPPLHPGHPLSTSLGSLPAGPHGRHCSRSAQQHLRSSTPQLCPLIVQASKLQPELELPAAGTSFCSLHPAANFTLPRHGRADGISSGFCGKVIHLSSRQSNPLLAATTNNLILNLFPLPLGLHLPQLAVVWSMPRNFFHPRLSVYIQHSTLDSLYYLYLIDHTVLFSSVILN